MGRRKIDSSPFDRITEDGILCLILSFLTLKEAVRTCVLSRRWRHVWTCLPNLEIDGKNMLHASNFRITEQEKYAAKFRDRFITSVHSFLQHRPAVGVHEFWLEYALHKIHSHHLEAWVDYAVASKAKLLFFILGSYQPWNHINKKQKPCEFPCHLLGSSSIEKLCLVSCSLKPPHGFDGLSHLKVLQLCQVNVSEEDIKRLLSNCFTLESLGVEGSQTLVTLSISHPLSRLTHLELQDCEKLKKVDINAVMLTEIYYKGQPVEFIFRESLQVTKAIIYFESSYMDYALTILSNNLPLLEDLRFEINDSPKEFVDLARSSTRFTRLRYLEWGVPPSLRNNKSRLCLAFLLSAAPFLEKLSFHCGYGYMGDSVDQIERMTPSPHTHLKIVDFSVFYGDKWQVMLVVYILKSATKLESVILQKPREKRYKKCLEKNMGCLMQEIPTNVKLVVL